MKKVKKILQKEYVMELDQQDRDWVEKELNTPLKSLAKLLEDTGVMNGAIQDITSHLLWKIRDLKNGKTTGRE